VDFDRPEAEGLDGAVNFYLHTPDGAKIGVWHALPESMVEESKGQTRDWYELKLSYGAPVVLYMHGNTGSRAREHRIAMYHVLRRLGYHVVSFDYRGYADSSPVIPTKCGVITDGHAVYEYVQSLAGEAPVFVWGHSLGTGVSSAILAELSTAGKKMPKALVLESPFNNIRDEVRAKKFLLFLHFYIFLYFFLSRLPSPDSSASHDVSMAKDAFL
jgi:abhydrolase domain-containing protein 12